MSGGGQQGYGGYGGSYAPSGMYRQPIQRMGYQNDPGAMTNNMSQMPNGGTQQMPMWQPNQGTQQPNLGMMPPWLQPQGFGGYGPPRMFGPRSMPSMVQPWMSQPTKANPGQTPDMSGAVDYSRTPIGGTPPPPQPPAPPPTPYTPPPSPTPPPATPTPPPSPPPSGAPTTVGGGIPWGQGGPYGGGSNLMAYNSALFLDPRAAASKPADTSMGWNPVTQSWEAFK